MVRDEGTCSYTTKLVASSLLIFYFRGMCAALGPRGHHDSPRRSCSCPPPAPIAHPQPRCWAAGEQAESGPTVAVKAFLPVTAAGLLSLYAELGKRSRFLMERWAWVTGSWLPLRTLGAPSLSGS